MRHTSGTGIYSDSITKNGTTTTIYNNRATHPDSSTNIVTMSNSYTTSNSYTPSGLTDNLRHCVISTRYVLVHPDSVTKKGTGTAFAGINMRRSTLKRIIMRLA